MDDTGTGRQVQRPPIPPYPPQALPYDPSPNPLPEAVVSHTIERRLDSLRIVFDHPEIGEGDGIWREPALGRCVFSASCRRCDPLSWVNLTSSPALR
jgi:hypothetical protein